MCKTRASMLGIVLLFLMVAPHMYGEIVLYNFSSPQFVPGQRTPISNVAPNIGSSTFLASFSANTSYYSIVTQSFPLFTGQILKSQCFCAQVMTITFNRPVYGVSLNFASVAPGFILTLTSAVGSASATYGATGGTLTFLSAEPFTSIQLGTGVFAIDDLAIKTDPPTPEQAIALLMQDVVTILEEGSLTQDQADGLMDKLATAATTLDLGNSRAASHQLAAFVNQVNAFIRARKISLEEGQSLIDAAEDIRARIGG